MKLLYLIRWVMRPAVSDLELTETGLYDCSRIRLSPGGAPPFEQRPLGFERMCASCVIFDEALRRRQCAPLERGGRGYAKTARENSSTKRNRY